MMIEKDQTWYNIKTNSVVIVLNHPGNFGDVELSHMSGRKTKNKQHYFKYQYRHCELGVVEEPKQRRIINMKKTAILNVIKKLEEEQGKIREKISRNKYDMKKLSEQQTTNKRELVVIQDLIRGLQS